VLAVVHVDVIAAAAAAYELSTVSRELFSEWVIEAVAVRSDSAEHDRDVESG
jgi:hypothetical protein